jgi:hypothetical protein
MECTCAYSVNFKSFGTSSYSFSGLYGSLSLYRDYQTLVFNTDFISSGRFQLGTIISTMRYSLYIGECSFVKNVLFGTRFVCCIFIIQIYESS